MNKDWKKIAVAPTTSMRNVLVTIDKGVMQIALVVDENNHLLGTTTDGDIRRALLRGDDLDTPVSQFMNSNAISGLIDEDPSSWQRAMQKHSLQHLPLLDAQGCITKLVRYISPEEPKRDNNVIIMAGGMGTRLRPLTENKPKPLLEVGGKPIIQTIIENFANHGFYTFHLCINYQGEKIKRFCGDGKKWGVDIQYIEENKRLGTAGALSLLSSKPQLPFFVVNGDVLTNVDFVRMLGFHEKLSHQATMCVREYRYQVPYGVVQLEEHKIVKLTEKPMQYFNVNAGVYLLESSALKYIPTNEYFDMTSLFDQLIVNKENVGSFPIREYWMDVGRFEDFEQADNDYYEQFK